MGVIIRRLLCGCKKMQVAAERHSLIGEMRGDVRLCRKNGLAMTHMYNEYSSRRAIGAEQRARVPVVLTS